MTIPRRLLYCLCAIAVLLAAGTPSIHATCADSAKCCKTTVLRPVNSMFSLSVGGASVLDTYLTPIRYNGTSLRLGYDRYQAMKFAPEQWIMQLSAGATYDKVKNPVKSHSMHAVFADFSWGMMHRWRITRGLQLYAGASTSVDGGAIYNALNSNNPVSVKIHWSLNPTAMAAYNINVGKLPVTLRYQATISMFGLFFSPDYGEAFYEIYLGNRANLVHFGWWGNRFDMTNALTADLHIGNTALRIGYRGDISTSWVNNINTHIFNHCFTIGVGGDWISCFKSKHRSNDRYKIISAFY